MEICRGKSTILIHSFINLRFFIFILYNLFNNPSIYISNYPYLLYVKFSLFIQLKTIYPTICLPIWLLYSCICLHTYVSICQNIYLSIVSIPLYLHPSLCLHILTSAFLSTYASIYLFPFQISINLFASLSWIFSYL